MPPKPNELESAMSMLRLRATCGARSTAVSTEGLSRLSVGGAIPSRMARMEKIASTAPAAPSRWPMADLVEETGRRSTAQISSAAPIKAVTLHYTLSKDASPFKLAMQSAGPAIFTGTIPATLLGNAAQVS